MLGCLRLQGPVPLSGLGISGRRIPKSFLRLQAREKITATVQGFSGKVKKGFASSERLQFLAGLEAHCFAGRDADFLAGAGISADAGLAGAHVENTEAPQLNSLAFAERILHGLEDSFDGLLRL